MLHKCTERILNIITFQNIATTFFDLINLADIQDPLCKFMEHHLVKQHTHTQKQLSSCFPCSHLSIVFLFLLSGNPYLLVL